MLSNPLIRGDFHPVTRTGREFARAPRFNGVHMPEDGCANKTRAGQSEIVCFPGHTRRGGGS
jgi:hypothetical protein